MYTLSYPTNYQTLFAPIITTNTKKESGAKRLYTILNKNNDQPSVKAKWGIKLNTIINENEWNCIFELPFLITNDVKVQWFQYRIIHRILGTNSLLNKMKITDDPLCTFCKQSEENLEHLFWECQISKAIVDGILPGQSFPFINRTIFLLGYLTKSASAINNVILFIKLYLYKCKMNKCIPSIAGAKKYIKYEYDNLKKYQFQKII